MRAALTALLLLGCSDATVKESSYPDLEPPRGLALPKDSGLDSEVDLFVHQWIPPAQLDEGVVDKGPDAGCPFGSRRDCEVSGDLEGACARGIQVCSNGEWGQCTSLTGPRNEVCDGVDNDCDGSADEGPGDHFPVLTVACYEGSGASSKFGSCRPGVRMCVNLGEEGFGYSDECTGQVLPSDEVCDQVDNDCNGLVDDFVFLGDACLSDNNPVGVGVCSAGTMQCESEEMPVCVGEITPSEELCDELDNDCDGSVDENLGVCNCGNPLFVPRPETCNGEDDDCDGIVDNERPGLNVRLSTMCYTNQDGDLVPVGNEEEFPQLNPPCVGGRALCEQNAEGVSGYYQCVGETRPGRERCNGLDDDCDGSLDEGFLEGSAIVVFGIDISGSMERRELETAVEVADRALARLAANPEICYVVTIIGHREHPVIVPPGNGCLPAEGNNGVNAREALQSVIDQRWHQGAMDEGTWDLIYDVAIDDRDVDGDFLLENVSWHTSEPAPGMLVDINFREVVQRIVIIIGDEVGQTNRGLTQEQVAEQVHASGTVVYVISPFNSVEGAVETILPSYTRVLPQSNGDCSASPGRGFCDFFYPIVRGRDHARQIQEIESAMEEVMGDLECLDPAMEDE